MSWNSSWTGPGFPLPQFMPNCYRIKLSESIVEFKMKRGKNNRNPHIVIATNLNGTPSRIKDGAEWTMWFKKKEETKLKCFKEKLKLDLHELLWQNFRESWRAENKHGEKKKGCVSQTSGHILLWGLLMPISRRFKLSIVMWQNRHIAETTQEAGFLLSSTMHGGTSTWAGEDPGKCQPWARGRGVHCADGCALGLPPSWVYPPSQAKMMRRGTSSCLTVHKDSSRHSTTRRAPGSI